LAEKDRNKLLSYLENRFGIPQTLFDDYLLFKKKKSWWLMKNTPLIEQSSGLKVWRVGLKAFQEVGIYIKPTTRMIQSFGHRALRAFMDITEGDLERLAGGYFIPANMGIDNGYIILAMKGRILGLGLLIDGKVRSQIPKKDTRFMNYR
jgi:NOL1/NOP2/fmu family ribosome biogenesis protein